MKKLFLLCAIISSTIFANDKFDIIEERVEDQFKFEKVINLDNYDIDYDVDIYNNQMNLGIEIEGLKKPTINFPRVKKNILKVIKKNNVEVDDIYIVVKYESLTGNEITMFTESHKILK
nr:hypothetical protein [uncultured Cetobacterium sp.]